MPGGWNPVSGPESGEAVGKMAKDAVDRLNAANGDPNVYAVQQGSDGRPKIEKAFQQVGLPLK